MSGFALLCWVYYGQSQLFLIDPAVMPLEPWQAAAIGIVALALGWLVYDFLCRSPLGAQRAAAGGGRLRLRRGDELGLHPGLFRPRRAHPHRRADGDDDDRQRVLRHHAEPAEERRRADGRQDARSEMGEDVEDPLDPQQLHHAARPVHDAVEPLPGRPSPTRGSFRRSSPASSWPARWSAISTIVWHADHDEARRGGPGRWRRSRSSAPSSSPRPLRRACAA